MSVSSAKLAQLARIVVVGQITGKHSYYDLIGAVRKLDARLPPNIPLLLHLEDLVATRQTGGEFELNEELKRVKKSREIFTHVVDACAGTGPLVALLCANYRTATVPSLIGGFGDVAVVRDTSKKAETEGRKIHVIRATGSQYKGVGTDGETISIDRLGIVSQPVLDRVELMFDELRKFKFWTADQAAEIKSGKMFQGDNLTRLRFVQRFKSTDEAFAEFLAVVEKARNVP